MNQRISKILRVVDQRVNRFTAAQVDLHPARSPDDHRIPKNLFPEFDESPPLPPAVPLGQQVVLIYGQSVVVAMKAIIARPFRYASTKFIEARSAAPKVL